MGNLTSKGRRIYRGHEPITKNCLDCGIEIVVPKASAKRRKFCSKACYSESLRGVRLAPTTEFKPGLVPHNVLPIGHISILIDKQGKQRAWIKIAEHKWRQRAALVWEIEYGPIPRGYVPHHKDRNTLNDSLDNLELLTRAEHLLEHREEFEQLRKERASIAVKAHWEKFREEHDHRGSAHATY